MKPFWKWMLVFATGGAYFIAAPAIYQGLKIGEHTTPFDVGMMVMLTGIVMLIGSPLVALLFVGVFALISWLLAPEDE